MPSVHRQTFVDLVNQHGWTRGAELGVDKGILTGMLLRGCPTLRSLTAVDVFPDRQRSRRVFEFASEYPALRILEGDSADMASSVPHESLDFVFIDADHSRTAVLADIAKWQPKVRKGGWVGGHDYHVRKFPCVVSAVQENYGPHVRQWPGTIWGVWK